MLFPIVSTVCLALSFCTGTNARPTEQQAEYYGIALPSQPILDALDSTFQLQSDTTSTFYNTLQSTNRIQSSFHVTLIHSANAYSNPDVWAYYQKLLSQNDNVAATVTLKNIVWDDRVMAISVAAQAVDGQLLPSADAYLHVTVGTVSKQVKPMESNDLLSRWFAGEQGIQSLAFGGVVEVNGTVTAF